MAGYLNCFCESPFFHDIYKLRELATGGVVAEIAGKVCTKCGKQVDTASLRELREKREKDKELNRAGKEVAEKLTKEQGKAVKSGSGAPLPDAAA